MKLRTVFASAAALSVVFLTLPGQAQTVRGTTFGTVSGTAPGSSRLAGGLQVKVRITQGFNSKTAAEGDEWDGVLATDLITAGHLVTPAGTQVTGVVSRAISASRAEGNGTLALRLTSIHGSGVNSTPVVRTGINPALTSTGNAAAAGIPGEAGQGNTGPAVAVTPGAAPSGQVFAEAHIGPGSILSFTTE